MVLDMHMYMYWKVMVLDMQNNELADVQRAQRSTTADHRLQ